MIVCPCVVCPHPGMVMGPRRPARPGRGAERANDARSSFEMQLTSCPLSCGFGRQRTCMPGVSWRMLHPRAGPTARWAEKDPLAGAGMWAHGAQVHMLVLPAQKANSEGRVLTSCGTRGEQGGSIHRCSGALNRTRMDIRSSSGFILGPVLTCGCSRQPRRHATGQEPVLRLPWWQ